MNLTSHISIEISDIEETKDGKYMYVMNWSDCPMVFVFKDQDYAKVSKVKNLLEKRLHNYLELKANGFETSDIEGLQYMPKLKRSNI